MSNIFWNVDEMQQIFDESTESIITKSEITAIGDRLKSQGYKLFRMSNLGAAAGLVADIPAPRPSLILEVGDKLHPLVVTAIAILREALEGDKADERKVDIALKILDIAFTSGIVDS